MRGFLILSLRFGILVLLEKCIAQVVMPFEGVAVFLQSAAVIHLRSGEILFVVLFVSSAHIGGFLLCKSTCGKEYYVGYQKYAFHIILSFSPR